MSTTTVIEQAILAGELRSIEVDASGEGLSPDPLVIYVKPGAAAQTAAQVLRAAFPSHRVVEKGSPMAARCPSPGAGSNTFRAIQAQELRSLTIGEAWSLATLVLYVQPGAMTDRAVAALRTVFPGSQFVEAGSPEGAVVHRSEAAREFKPSVAPEELKGKPGRPSARKAKAA